MNKMNQELKEKFAPRRNKRHPNVRDFNTETAWAETLDWKNSDYAFQQLLQSVLNRIDSDYREQLGLRIDQLADLDELYAVARSAASHYQREEHHFRTLGFYVYLHSNLRLYLGCKAQSVLERRKEVAMRLFTLCATVGRQPVRLNLVAART